MKVPSCGVFLSAGRPEVAGKDFMQILVTWCQKKVAPNTKQTSALFSNKPSSTFIAVKYTLPIQSNYCDCFYCHCPVVSSCLSPTPPS